MVTRRDWWIGVTIIVLALLVHAALPRFEFRQYTNSAGIHWVRIDHWTGRASLVDVQWEPSS